MIGVNKMSNIKFERIKRKSTFLSPLLNYNEDNHYIEHRRDPLTNTRSLIGYNLENKSQMLYGITDQNLIKKIVQESQSHCFMCPDKVDTATPKYSKDLIPEERITVGEATLFPNLFPISEYHAVCALTQAHYIALDEFTPKLISDGLQACLKFIHKAFNMNNSAKYMTINSNFLFPAGASAIHPHMQVLGGDIPFTFLERLYDGSLQYYTQNQKNYWKDLITQEKASDERYIGQTGSVEWLTSFSPLGTNEVQGIICDKPNFLELNSDDLNAFSIGLSNILGYYAKNGFSTFNFSLYSGPLDESVDWFWTNLRVVTRSNVYENYRASEYFLQKLLGNEILLTSPENLATQLKRHF